ncbi:MAG TPA: Uma2 family endonuclease [Pyrinomonadaceae bacterium]|nr:Uma2 family endonuclease [Pyrinomonadaceae bacterium]
MATEVLDEATEGTLTRRRATIEEFWGLPESVLPVEYVNGEIVMAPAPTPKHQTVSRSIFRALDGFALRESLGEVFYSPFDVVLPSGDVVQPDIFFLTPRESEGVPASKRLHTVPSLVVEILSPGTATHDAITKRELYQKNGVREYWIVDIETRSIARLVLRKKRYVLKEFGEDETINSSVLEGFEMNVGELIGLK